MVFLVLTRTEDPSEAEVLGNTSSIEGVLVILLSQIYNRMGLE